jgi:hypothetical protein
MARVRKPIPKNQSQITQEALPPAYLQSQGKPVQDTLFTHNRALKTSRKNDKVKDINVGLEDIDGAIKYYFDNVIKPTIVLDGQLHAVPTMYASPERWQSVQAEGYFRDSNGKLTIPLIIYKRINVEKNRTLGNKIDGNNVSLFQLFESRYNQKNIYDNFSVLTNRIPSKQYYMSVVPDYVTVTYDVVVFTNYVAENNKIIEAIEFASDSYWGNPNRWHFRTMLDSLATTTTINTGEDRFAQTTITLKVNGYLVPDSINKKLANSSIAYSTSQVVFGVEVVGDVNETFNATSQIAASQASGQTSFVGGGTNFTNNITNISAAASGDLTYLNTNITKIADTITVPNTAIFTGAALLQPAAGSTLPATTKNNFVFYISGQNINVNYITLVEAEGNVTLIFDTASIGYTLDTTDEIVAIGKFQ